MLTERHCTAEPLQQVYIKNIKSKNIKRICVCSGLKS